MKVEFILKKTPVVFILFLCFVVSFSIVEAGRSIRVRKVKTHVAPRHISLSARSGNGMYARTFAYGRPIPNYSTKSITRRYSQRRRYGKRERLPRTYAHKYRNWSPNARKSPRADKIGQLKRRKELLPFLSEPPYGPNKYKRRVRPQRPNPMQRPKPPKKPNREEFDDEYFFPEESKRGTKHEFESRYPRPKKKRRPDFESYYKPIGSGSKIPYYDEKPLGYKTKPREPPFSYSSFIQHPSGSSDDPDDLYEDPDSVYSQPLVRNKKKRVKKKSNKKKNKPFVFDSDSSNDYPPYGNHDDYDLPVKTYKKRNKPSYDGDDEFVPSRTYPQAQLQASNLFSTELDYSRKKTAPVQFGQSWSSVVETTARPVQYQTENGFQPQQYVPAHNYNYNNDYSTLQKTKTVTTNTRQTSYYSQPDNSYKTTYNNNNNNYASQVSTTQSQSPSNYNANYNTNYNTNYNANYNQPLPASSSVLTDVTIQKSVPIYDNTETFYNFNNNAYVNSQSSKYYNSDRVSASSGTKVGEKTDSDSEFLKKHQNLYNQGLSGVPVQGDGFAKESAKKDYDIGYGDFQFDENPNT